MAASTDYQKGRIEFTDPTVLPKPESEIVKALREQLAAKDAEVGRLKKDRALNEDFEKAFYSAEAQLAAAVERIRVWAQAYHDDERHPIDSRLERKPYFENCPAGICREEAAFLADPANAKVVQRAQKDDKEFVDVAKRVIPVLVEALVEIRDCGENVFVLKDIARQAVKVMDGVRALLADEPDIAGANDPTLRDLTSFTQANEPEVPSRKHEGQHYDSSLDCSCCNTCGKPIAECTGRELKGGLDGL